MVCSLLRHLMAFGRVMRIYAEGHSRVEDHLTELKAIADEMFAARAEEVRIEMRPDGLTVDRRTLHQEPAVVETFADAMRARGIRAILLRSGIRKEELRLLADVLARSARELVAGGGLEESLAGENHPHFTLLAAVTAFGEGGNYGGDDVDGEPEQTNTCEFEELLGEAGGKPPDPSVEHRLVYTACGEKELGTRSSNLLAVAEETLRAEARRHDAERTAALALCDMVGRARDELEYQQRRALLCDVVREKRIDPRAMRIAQLHLAGDVPNWRHEKPDALLLELGAIAADTQLLECALSRSQLPEPEARKAADAIASRPDAFHLFSVLLRAGLPDNLRAPVEDAFLELARGKRAELRRWAMEHPHRFLAKTVFGLLLARDDSLVGPIVREYLLGASSKERDRLLDLLASEGTEKALRLLLAGARDGGEVHDPRIILAVGRFRHPLAVHALREIVERCNTEQYDADQASSAIRALAEIGDDGAVDFLEEVRCRRKLLMPVYRRSLRDMAQEALEVA